jgi:hypothetical protein
MGQDFSSVLRADGQQQDHDMVIQWLSGVGACGLEISQQYSIKLLYFVKQSK